MADEKFKKCLKNKFPDVFSEGLGKFLKIKATFELKDNVVLVFKLKRSVLFVALESINLGTGQTRKFHSWITVGCTDGLREKEK